MQIKNIHLDLETYSVGDLKKIGAWAYSCHKTTEVICMAYSFEDDEPILWTPKEPWPFDRKITESYIFHAHNSFFEYAVLKNTLKVPTPKISNWRDTAAMAAALSLPRSLGQCGTAIGLSEDKQKDKRGRYLIQRLCKPYRQKRCQDPKLIDELKNYCKQDVVAEREVSKRLRPLSETEQKVWELDKKINTRGLYIDMAGVDNCIEIRDQVTIKLNKEVEELTSGALTNVSQRDLVMQYIDESCDYFLDKYDKNYLKSVLADEALPGLARRLIEIRLQLGKTSIAKYDALKALAVDSRVRGLLMYHGASTGRWSGKHFQPQNLPRPTISDPETALDTMVHKDLELVEAMYGDVLEVLSSCVRSVIAAPPGHDLMVADYSQIEARCLPWLAGQTDTLEVFERGEDVYKHEASKMYRKPSQEIDKEERFVGKVAVLALGYQGGKLAFQNMARIYGVEISEERADQIKEDWRNANKKIVQYWYDIEKAALQAVKNKGQTFKVRNVQFRTVKNFLFCKLPSGRLLSYVRPTISENRFGKECVSFWGTNSVTRKWEQTDTYGGKLVENITQAVARDLMALAMLRVEDAGYKVVLSVHDELITEIEEDKGDLEEFEKLMCTLPTWAKGLPVDAEGYRAKRYRK